MNENIESKKPKGFLWMDEWAELTADLTAEQMGILLIAAQNFHLGKDYDIGQDKELKMAFRFISSCIKQNDEKYDRACKLKKEARERQIRQRQAKAGKSQDMPANAEICQDMPANANYQNTNQNTNQIPYGEGDNAPAPAREVDFDFETYGIMENVKMKPSQYRHLIESYGEETAKEVIDAFSCKLADGSTDSANHFATIVSWLGYRRRMGSGSVPLSSKAAEQSQAAMPPPPPPQEERELTDSEQAIIDEWNVFTAQRREEKEKYAKLNEIAQRHGGIAPELLPKLGMMQWKDKWIFK